MVSPWLPYSRYADLSMLDARDEMCPVSFRMRGEQATDGQMGQLKYPVLAAQNIENSM